MGRSSIGKIGSASEGSASVGSASDSSSNSSNKTNTIAAAMATASSPAFADQVCALPTRVAGDRPARFGTSSTCWMRRPPRPCWSSACPSASPIIRGAICSLASVSYLRAALIFRCHVCVLPCKHFRALVIHNASISIEYFKLTRHGLYESTAG